MIRSRKPLAVSIPAFCNLVSIGRSTVYLEIAAGRLNAIKCRGRRLILLDEVTRYLQSLAS